ncbi:ATP-dependent DNA helicase RecG [Rhizomicrobium palustre]|uniref:ATP-dependent DNA helicase RecG n=1 Tax=Rhizomicrobium palustre TaxID=189966 RepID=A0A846MUK4_9PROT|nr:ATP-dependent DNA helicase RecG [Rhizomicrobium palustre]NIK86881.1 ATP-dependent DNA helicase RecG [Rhizomicrobium palustre]
MRPSILFPLFADTRSLPGVGPRLEKLISQVAGTRLKDLIFHLPTGVIDRSYRPKLIAAEAGRIVTASVNVLDHLPPRDKRQPFKVRCSDDTATIELVFFHAHQDWLNKSLPVGSQRVISGKVERFNNRLSMPHPDFIAAPGEEMPLHEPVYALTEGLSGKVLSKAIRGALEKVSPLPEWLDPAYQKKMKWPAFHEAIKAAHSPVKEADLAPETPERQRLAYDELLSNQLALMLVRKQMREVNKGRVLKAEGRLKAKALAALHFTLTEAQQQAIAEIEADMASPQRMLRLLQGDVGAGKTVVAFMALLDAVEAGTQGALMAPTEILSRQHMAGLEKLAEASGVKMALLTGREKGAPRAALLKALAEGEIDILIGTHALFSDDVVFKDLGLVVVDEQHRFGVHQRMTLQGKGEHVTDVLVMTATPIPRTLALTAYGDMEVSRLFGRPPGRQPIETRVLPVSRLEDVVEHLRKALAAGTRAYWVCPLVEESEKIDLAAAEDRARELSATLGPKVGLVHGKMKAAERDAAMAKFKAGELQLLVATTVIEVGVDVPEATIMVVEHAERFGLAQLHQLRGRVGRGSGKSSCLLVYAPPLGETAKARLSTLRDTDDGFVIAEEDLKLRGPGELLGTRQSGQLEFRLADISAHGELLACARDDAALILSRDPDLKSDRGVALRVLLYLFGQDEAVKYLRAG